MKRLTVAWNILCGLAAVGLTAMIAPKLIRHFTYAPDGRPLWQDSWPLSVEGVFVVVGIVICAIAVSSLYAGRINPVRRVAGGILSLIVLGVWVYSSLQWMGESLQYAFQKPSLSREMMTNDGMAFGTIALLFLLVGVASGRGLFWWFGRFLAKIKKHNKSAHPTAGNVSI